MLWPRTIRIAFFRQQPAGDHGVRTRCCHVRPHHCLIYLFVSSSLPLKDVRIFLVFLVRSMVMCKFVPLSIVLKTV